MYEELDLYIGVKLVGLKAMTRGAYNTYRGWDLPSDEDGTDEGYLVEYKDGGKANHPEHVGYISWSPKEVADKAYRLTEGMTFGMAVEALKKGYKVRRSGWNGSYKVRRGVSQEGMWLLLVPGSPDIKPVAGTPYSNAGLIQSISIDAHIDMFTVQGTMQPGWLASQADMLADDWELVI